MDLNSGLGVIMGHPSNLMLAERPKMSLQAGPKSFTAARQVSREPESICNQGEAAV